MGAADAWHHVVERAEHDGVAVGGQHNINHVVRLTAEEARALDRPQDARVVVRRRRADVPPW